MPALKITEGLKSNKVEYKTKEINPPCIEYFHFS